MTDTTRYNRNALDLIGYYQEQLDDRRRQPRDDLISALLAAEITEDYG